MDHLVYLDEKSKEFDKIERGVKTHLIRASSGKMLPYKKVFEGDVLYFINNNGEGALKAKAVVKSVVNSPKMAPEESVEFIAPYIEALRLSATQEKRMEGKRFMVIIEVMNFERIPSIEIDLIEFGGKGDWFTVGDIHNAKML